MLRPWRKNKEYPMNEQSMLQWLINQRDTYCAEYHITIAQWNSLFPDKAAKIEELQRKKQEDGHRG